MIYARIYKQKAGIVNGALNDQVQMAGNAAAGVYVMRVIVEGQSYQYRLVYVK
ncbi:MAG TPA: hypothetical protein VJU78_11975 [Chitinophagaceae bacterium]|nr:hypothetical protein [Chitinophagaceae bacterium]